MSKLIKVDEFLAKKEKDKKHVIPFTIKGEIDINNFKDIQATLTNQ
jgi:predicted transcriptional regulator